MRSLPVRMSCLLVGVLAAEGCKRPPDVAHPRRYESETLTFQHPANWTPTSSERSFPHVHLRTVTFEPPGSGFLIVEEYTPAIDVDLRRFVDTVVGEIRARVSGTTAGLVSVVEQHTEDIERKLLGSMRRGLRTTFRVQVVKQPVPHTSEVVLARADDRSIVVFWQVADQYRALAEPGFRQIIETLELRAPAQRRAPTRAAGPELRAGAAEAP